MNQDKIKSNFRCGMISLIGCPNTGKSTLLNRLLGENLAIATHKPQTTRKRMQGILNQAESQIILVDTPGIPPSSAMKKKIQLSEYFMDQALEVLKDVDLVVWVLDSSQGLRESDLEILSFLESLPREKILVVCNKIDRLENPKEQMLYLIDSIQEKTQCSQIVPVSALKGTGVDQLLQEMESHLPVGPPLYPVDQISDQNDRHIAAEILRKYLMLTMNQELPYSIAVEVDAFKEEEGIIRIHSMIFVERESQKGMVIGKKGEQLKRVGQRAREEMEEFFQKKIFLETQVKTLKNWTKDANLLKRLGYEKAKT